jgi:hypothetical protein
VSRTVLVPGEFLADKPVCGDGRHGGTPSRVRVDRYVLAGLDQAGMDRGCGDQNRRRATTIFSRDRGPPDPLGLRWN